MEVFNVSRTALHKNVIYGFSTKEDPTRIRYVGQTVDFRRRMKEYRRSKKNPKTASEFWLVRHGWDNILVHILEFCAEGKNLDDQERYWIEFHQTYRKINKDGLNGTLGGNACTPPDKSITSAKLTAQEINLIREEYHSSNISCTALSKKFSVSKTTIVDIISRNSWRTLPRTGAELVSTRLITNKGTSVLSPSQIEAIRCDRENGMTYKELSLKYTVCMSTVYRLLSGQTYQV